MSETMSREKEQLKEENNKKKDEIKIQTKKIRNRRNNEKVNVVKKM